MMEGMKKWFTSSIMGIFLLIGFLFLSPIETFAQNKIPLPQSEKYDSIINENRIITKIGDGSSENFLKRIFTGGDTSLVLAINIVIAAIAVAWIAILATKFIASQGEEEKITNYKKQFGFIVLGLLTISVAEFTAFNLLNPTTDILDKGQGTFINNLYSRLDVLIAFIRYLVGGVVIIIGGMSAYKLITGGDQDEKRQAEKTFLKAFFLGTVFILLAEVIVRIVSLEQRTGASVSPEYGIQVGIIEISGLINFILTFIGGAAFLALIFAALFYIISFGQEEQAQRAKKMILYCIIAIVVALSAYSLTSYIVSRYNNGALIQEFKS